MQCVCCVVCKCCDVCCCLFDDVGCEFVLVCMCGVDCVVLCVVQQYGQVIGYYYYVDGVCLIGYVCVGLYWCCGIRCGGDYCVCLYDLCVVNLFELCGV